MSKGKAGRGTEKQGKEGNIKAIQSRMRKQGELQRIRVKEKQGEERKTGIKASGIQWLQ